MNDTPPADERHVKHYRNCNCLGDSARCCDPTCCTPPADVPTARQNVSCGYCGTNLCGCGTGDTGKRHYTDGLPPTHPRDFTYYGANDAYDRRDSYAQGYDDGVKAERERKTVPTAGINVTDEQVEVAHRAYRRFSDGPLFRDGLRAALEAYAAERSKP